MENNLTSQDVAHIARSVISKDRRVVYSGTELEKIAPEVLLITNDQLYGYGKISSFY
jgi:hypothetical protein